MRSIDLTITDYKVDDVLERDASLFMEEEFVGMHDGQVILKYMPLLTNFDIDKIHTMDDGKHIINRDLNNDLSKVYSMFNNGLMDKTIINKNHSMPYHGQHGVQNGYQIILYFIRDIIGGNLVIPKYNIKIKPINQFCLLLKKDNILHGITKFAKRDENSYRYSILLDGK